MKVPVSWLREYVSFDLPVEELGRRLVFTSCEVDRIVRRGVPDGDGNLGRFRVGRVLEATKHPNADRLQLCSVDVGEGDARASVRSGQVDPTRVLTKTEPMSDAIAAYKAFDKRQAGWIKVELRPGA